MVILKCWAIKESGTKSDHLEHWSFGKHGVMSGRYIHKTNTTLAGKWSPGEQEIMHTPLPCHTVLLFTLIHCFCFVLPHDLFYYWYVHVTSSVFLEIQSTKAIKNEKLFIWLSWKCPVTFFAYILFKRHFWTEMWAGGIPSHREPSSFPTNAFPMSLPCLPSPWDGMGSSPARSSPGGPVVRSR